MRRLRAALENEEVAAITDDVVTDSTDTVIVDNQAQVEEIISDLDKSIENDSIVESTTAIADTVEKNVEAGIGMDETISDIVAQSLEHFYDRFDYSCTKLHSTSLESFSNQDSRLDATKLVLEELKEFNTFAIKQNVIAQEGIMARLGNTIKLIFNTQEGIHEKLITALSNIEQNGAKEALIAQPGWGRSFAVIGKRELTPADVISYVEKYNRVISSPELSNLATDYTNFVDRLSSELSKSRFIANNDAIKEIQKMTDELATYKAKIDIFLGDNKVTTAKNDPSFKTLDVSSAKKLAKDTIAIISNNKIDAALKRVNQAINTANATIFIEAHTRLVGLGAKDIRAARHMVMKLNPIMYEFFNIVNIRNRVCYAVLNYIKASTNK